MSAANGHRGAPIEGRWLTPPPVDDGSSVWSDDRYAAGARDGYAAGLAEPPVVPDYANYVAPPQSMPTGPTYSTTYTSPHHGNYHANYGTNFASPQALPPYWPQPHGLRRPVDGFAITSLIFGLIGGFLFSIGFALAAFRRIGQGRRRGRPLAIAGLILSAAWILADALAFVIVRR
jgi:hypothetical protein